MNDQDVNRGPWYFGISLAVSILAVTGVSLRWYTRFFLTRSYGSDDFAMIIPVLSTIGGEVVDIYNVEHGWGRHAKYLSSYDLFIVGKVSMISWLRVFITYFFIRASIMLFTLRLLPCTKTWAHRIIYLAFFLNFAITLIACVCYGVRCTPFRAAYEEVPGSHCKSDTLLIASQQANGILACIIDITTALIPAFLLWDLQMKKSTKTVLNSIFLLGLFTAGLSIGRAATTNKDTVGPDFPFTQTLPGIMSLVEVNMGMLFASCPVLRQLIAYIMRHGTMLPTKSRGPPNRDFIAMRKRITLRDIFWYRQSTPDEISPPPDAPPNKPREIPNTMIPVKLSAMDRVWRGLGRTFGVKRRDDLAQHHRTDSLSHSEKGLVGRGSGLLQESETSKESKKTFLLSASGNGSGIGWHLNSTTSADSSR